MLSAEWKKKGKIDSAALTRAVDRWLPLAGKDVEGQAKELCKPGWTNVKQSISYKVEKDYAVVFAGAHYATYLEYGTGIYAESGGGRKTPWTYRTPDGKFFRTVGMEHSPFMRPAIDARRNPLVKLLRMLYDQEVKKDGVK